MKADELLIILCRRVKGSEPGKRGAFVRIAESTGKPNWIAYAIGLDSETRERYVDHLKELRSSHPLVDWSGVLANRQRNIGKFLSEA